MAEKILNTRILMKVDTLENWGKSTLKLKNGELAFATVAATAGTGLTEPVVMVKIGTAEEKTFAELPWAFHAKASDVLSACKSEEALKTFINGVIADAGIASNDAMEALAGRVTTLEGYVGGKSVATQISEAIEGLDLANTYAAKDHDHEIADVTGLADAIADAKKAGTDANSALEAYKTTNDAAVQKVASDLAAEVTRADTAEKANAKAVSDLAAKVGTVEDGKTVVGMIAEAQEAATYDDTEVKADIATLKGYVTEPVSTTVDTAIEGLDLANTYEAKGAAADVQSDLDSYKETNDAAVQANTNAIAKLNGDADTEGSVDYKVAQEVAKILNDNDASDIDTLEEIAAWIKNDTAGVADLNARVAANATAITNEETRAKAAEEANAAAAAAAKSAADAAQADADALEKLVGTTSVADQISAAVSPVSEKVTVLEGKAHEHANKDVLDGVSAEKVAAWDAKVDAVTAAADSGLKAERTGNSVAIAIDESVTFVFDCGGAEVSA